MVKWRSFINMTIMGMRNQQKSNKRRKHENQKGSLSLPFSHGFIIKG